MAINLNEATLGTLPDRIGEAGAIVALVNTHWKTGGTYWTAFKNLEESLVGALTETGDVQKEHEIAQLVWRLFDVSQQAQEQVVMMGLKHVMQEVAKSHVNRDTGQFDEGGIAGGGGGYSGGAAPPTEPISSLAALKPVMQRTAQEIWRQMFDPAGTAPSVTVKKCTTTASASAGSLNTGNGLVVMSVKRPDGLNNPHVMGAKGRIFCVRSGHDDPLYKNRELFEYKEAGGPGPTHPDWAESTRGYGVTWQFTGCDPTAWCTGSSSNYQNQAGERGQLLANAFDSFHSDHPDRWVVVTGTAGTHYRRTNTQTYFGSYALEFIAGTGNITELKQVFNSDSGSSWVPEGNVPTVVLTRLRPAGTITGGILVLKLTNSSGTTLTDDQGVSLSKEITLSGIAAGAWSDNYDQWNLPKNIPDTAEFHIGMKTGNPLTGANLYCDSTVLTKMHRPYKGAWYIAHIAGSTAAVSSTRGPLGDYWDVTATNDNGGATHARGTYQRLVAMFLDTPEYEIALPETSGTADWDDAAIA